MAEPLDDEEEAMLARIEAAVSNLSQQLRRQNEALKKLDVVTQLQTATLQTQTEALNINNQKLQKSLQMLNHNMQVISPKTQLISSSSSPFIHLEKPQNLSSTTLPPQNPIQQIPQTLCFLTSSSPINVKLTTSPPPPDSSPLPTPATLTSNKPQPPSLGSNPQIPFPLIQELQPPLILSFTTPSIQNPSPYSLLKAPLDLPLICPILPLHEPQNLLPPQTIPPRALPEQDIQGREPKKKEEEPIMDFNLMKKVKRHRGNLRVVMHYETPKQAQSSKNEKTSPIAGSSPTDASPTSASPKRTAGNAMIPTAPPNAQRPQRTKKTPTRLRD